MIYKKIKELADLKGVSIWRVERDSGLANGQIGKWGKTANQKPSAETLKKVADYFQVPMEELMKKSDKEV